jgi:Protein of unknown function (DUF3352)
MPASMKPRLVLATAALTAFIALLAGCGSGSSSSDVATLAPPGSPVFVEGTVKPTGELKSNADAVAQKIGGIANLGSFVVEKLESSARAEGETLDYEKEVEPWLGEKAGAFFERLEGESLSGLGVLVESTDTAATREFVEKQAKSSKHPYSEKTFEGVEYELGGSEENAIGVVGDFLVIAEGEEVFKDVVKASKGESLADEDRFSTAISAASDGSLADVYVDVGGLIEESGGEIAPQARQILQKAGIDPSKATAVASVIPGSEQVEVDLSSDLGGEKPPSGDASKLLGSLPSTAFAAFAASGFGEQVQEALDSLDAEGIPGTIPPHQLKKGIKEFGIDLEGLVGSLREAAVFATGNSESSLGGALVVTAEGHKALEAVERAVTLVRAFHVKGVSLLGGKTSGFAVHSAELGPKPLVVAAREGRVAIGYGVPQTLLGLAAPSGKTLSDNPAYKEAVAALGGTPISGFVEGAAALKLAEALVPASEAGFQEAMPYLHHIAFVGIGTGTEGELATAKAIVGLK